MKLSDILKNETTKDRLVNETTEDRLVNETTKDKLMNETTNDIYICIYFAFLSVLLPVSLSS